MRYTAVILWSASLAACGGGGGGGGSGGGPVIPISGSALAVPQNGQTADYGFDIEFVESGSRERAVGEAFVFHSVARYQGPPNNGQNYVRVQENLRIETEDFSETTRSVLLVDSAGRTFGFEDDPGFAVQAVDFMNGDLPLVFPTALAVGQHFGTGRTYTLFDGGSRYRDVNQSCVVTARENVSTPAATFEAFRAECSYQETERDGLNAAPSDASASNTTAWIHPDYGIVKEVERGQVSLPEPGYTFTAELILTDHSRLP